MFSRRFLQAGLSLLIIQSFVASSPLRAQTPAPASPAPPAKEAAPGTPVVRETLPSGLRLIVEERPGAPLTAVEVRVRAGSAAEGAENNGVAHFIEHLVFKGGGERKPGDLDRAMEALGGEMTARTTRDSTQFGTVVPSAKWRDAVGLVAEMLTKPEFRPEDVETERRVVLAEMAAALNDPARTGFRAVCEGLFAPGDPYRQPLMGTTEAVAALTAEDVRGFWRRWYAPARLTLVLVGDVKVGDARRLAGQFFPVPPAAPVAPMPEPAGGAAFTDGVIRVTPAGVAEREVTTVYLGFRGPSGAEVAEMGPAVETLLTLMATGNRGRLAERLSRKEKRAFSVTAEYVPARAANLLLIGATGTPREAAGLEEAILAELRRMREDPFPDDEVAAGREEVLARLRYEGETVDGRARQLADRDVIGSPVSEAEYRKRLEAVTADDVKKAVARYLTPLRYAVATVGPPPPPRPSAAAPGAEAAP